MDLKGNARKRGNIMANRFSSRAVNLLAAMAFVVALRAICNASRAVVNRETGCTVLDGDGNEVTGDKSLVVQTNNDNNCNVTFTCKASGVPNTTGGTVKWNFNNTDLPCDTTVEDTEIWQETLTYSSKTRTGNASLICHVKTCI